MCSITKKLHLGNHSMTLESPRLFNSVSKRIKKDEGGRNWECG